MKQQSAQGEKTDKFGYASIQVGDSAALFSKHFEEFGPHYGRAAQSIGASLGANGSTSRALQAGQSFFQAGLPLLGTCGLMTTAAAAFQAAAHIRHSSRMGRLAREQLAVRKADHLLQLTQPQSLLAVLETALLYGREEKAKAIHLVVSDSYQAAQLRLQLQIRVDNIIAVFESLQEAFAAASSSKDENGKVLIYFHTLEPICVSQDLHISNCANFVLRSDVGQGGFQPRLVLKGKLRSARSTGTIQSVAVCGGFEKDESSQIVFAKCTTSPQVATTFSDPGVHSQNQQRTRTMGLGVMLVASVLVASAMLFPSREKERT